MSPAEQYNELHKELALPNPLRPYQWEGVNFLAHRDVALLADEMGLGKTVQAAVALRLLMSRGDCPRILIVTPASLRLNWERELLRWAPDLVVRRVDGSAADRLAWYMLPVPVLIASYEQIRADALFIHPSVSFDAVVLDEAQRIKNSGSETSLTCRMLRRRIAWALTGTPLENHPNDMLAIFKFLDLALLHVGMTRTEIHDKIRSRFLRRKKSEVLPELPPIMYQDIPLELEGQQLESYRELWLSRSDHISYADGVPSVSDMLAVLVKLKQLCNFDPVSGESVKFDALRTILEAMRGPEDKILVFSQYVETLRWISERLETPHAIFHGGLSEFDREGLVAHFEDRPGPQVLLVSLRAGGLGLNLPSASVVVMFDRWWNPAVESQAVQRAHRFGRRRALHVVRYLVVGSIEERIAEIFAKKQGLFEEYVETAPSALIDPDSAHDISWVLQLPSKNALSEGAVSDPS